MGKIELTEPEVAALVDFYTVQNLSMVEIIDRMGYCREVLDRHLREQGLSRAKRYTAEEDARFHRLVRTLTIPEMVEHFPGRTERSLRRRALALGLVPRVASRPYSEAEDDVIRTHYGRHPVGSWVHLLPGRTKPSIKARARAIGVRARGRRGTQAKSIYLETGHVASSLPA